jgi:anti-anti-sigma regulatory factor
MLLVSGFRDHLMRPDGLANQAMRLNLDSSVVESSTTLVVAVIIDWSTITQFRAALAGLGSRPEPAILVDFTGLLSWSPEAQDVLVRATGQARLHGGRLAVFGLAPIPAWQADGCELRDLDRALEHAAD